MLILSAPAPENCTSRKTLRLSDKIVPEIKAVIVNETTVTIEVTNTAPYSLNTLWTTLVIKVQISYECTCRNSDAFMRDSNFCNPTKNNLSL